MMKGNHDNPKRGMEFSYKGETLYLYIVKPGGIYLMCDDKSFGLGANYLELDKSVLEPLKSPQKQISKISDSQTDRLARYRKERDEYLKSKVTCEFPGCAETKLQLHHGAGRVGDLLFDKRYFKALCFRHHRLVEENPEVAKELKLSFSRLNKQP